MHPLFHERRHLIPFRSTLLPQVFTDTLVIGAGVAGLRAAIAAANHGDVIVLSKSPAGAPDGSCTAWAQGGVAGALGPDGDSTESDVESHVRDTLAAGAGLCDEPAVRRIVRDSASRLMEVLRWGLPADRDADGRLELAREGGHSTPRIIHALGDATGRALLRTLLDRSRQADRVRIFDRCFALDLITVNDEPGAPCMGAITHHPRFGLQMIWARATILASGGSGALWRETTNPRGSTGDALAMAHRAGATVADMAFMQFHPTTLYVAGAARSLISEAVRGEGASLLDSSGRRFMPDLHPLGDLAPRDVVSAAIVRQIAREGSTHVFLDARSIREFAARFPSIHRALADVGLDPARDLIPVHPAAHYMIGGVRTDEVGRTDVPGLYAAGETASSGLHGANRLASNSLLEGLVMGETAGRIAEEMREGAANGWGVSAPRAPAAVISDIPLSDHGELDLADVRSSLRSVMWRNVGVERAGSRLGDVTQMIDFWARYTLDKIFDDPAGWEAQNMLLVGALIARSAHWRAESRGCHRRTDAPEPSESLRAHDLWRRNSESPALEPVAAAHEAAR